jgi:hypothetical protein
MQRLTIALVLVAVSARAGEPALDPEHHVSLTADGKLDGCHKWHGTNGDRDEIFDAWLCVEGDHLTGWIKSDMPSYGWDRVTVEGTFSHDHRELAMHDVTTLEQHSVVPDGVFCLIDHYSLSSRAPGHLEGDYYGTRCRSGPGTMTLDLVREVENVLPAPLPVEKPVAAAGCSVAAHQGNATGSCVAAFALLLLLSSLRARFRPDRPA